jgi:hypothetical protein
MRNTFLGFHSGGSGKEAAGGQMLTAFLEEPINTPFCPLQEKFRTFVLRGLRNISEAP